RIKRAGVLDLLFTDLAPAWHLGGIIRSGRPGMDHIARANLVEQVLWVVRMRRVFHRIQVIQIAKELVEAVDGGQELVQIAEMVFTELAGFIALRLERGG